MKYLLLTFICLVPWGHFFFRNLDVWHGQGQFFQVGLLICFSYSLIEKGKSRINIPLALLTCWLGLTTLYWWKIALIDPGVYNIQVFFPFFNFLCIVLLYKLITGYLNEESLALIYRFFSYSIGLVLIFCVLQKLGLDQFYRHYSVEWFPDKVVGTIGNSTHLSNYLAICLPVFFLRRTWYNTLGIISTFGIILLVDSVSGLIIAVAVSLLFIVLKKNYTKLDLYLIGLLALGTLIVFFVKIGSLGGYLNPQGRIEFWSRFYEVFKERPILGGGLGLTRMLALTNGKNLAQWHHAHCEIYQLAVEGGLVAVGIVIYGLIDYFKRFMQIRGGRVVLVSGCIFIAFLMSSLINWTAHLWLTATIGLLGYSAIYALEGK